MSMLDNIIYFDFVSKCYCRGWFGVIFNVIENVGFLIGWGELVGFIGYNGVGKSIVICIIMGL